MAARDATPLHLVRARVDAGRWTLTVALDGAEVSVDVAAHTPEARAYRVVLGWAITYRGSSAHGARAADAVAAVLADLGSLEAVIAALRPPLRPLPPTVPQLAAFFDEVGAAAVDAAAPWQGSAAAVLPLWREAQLHAARTGATLRGIPRCLGGDSGSPESAPSGLCVVCADAPTCDAPARRDVAGDLRPRVSDEPLEDVLAVWSALGLAQPDAVSAATELRRGGTARAVYELGLSVGTDDRLGPARLTRYQEAGDPSPGIATFALLAGRAGERVVRSVGADLAGLGCHAGFAVRGDGRATKLYVTTDGLAPEVARYRLEKLIAAVATPVRLPPGQTWCWLAITIQPDGSTRLRVYETAVGVAPGDALADEAGTLGWDLGPRGLSANSAARYVHYLRSHLTVADSMTRLSPPPAVASQLARALDSTRARFYLRIIAHTATQRTLYAHVGPHAPTPLALMSSAPMPSTP